MPRQTRLPSAWAGRDDAARSCPVCRGARSFLFTPCVPPETRRVLESVDHQFAHANLRPLFEPRELRCHYCSAAPAPAPATSPLLFRHLVLKSGVDPDVLPRIRSANFSEALDEARALLAEHYNALILDLVRVVSNETRPARAPAPVSLAHLGAVPPELQPSIAAVLALAQQASRWYADEGRFVAALNGFLRDALVVLEPSKLRVAIANLHQALEHELLLSSRLLGFHKPNFLTKKLLVRPHCDPYFAFE